MALSPGVLQTLERAVADACAEALAVSVGIPSAGQVPDARHIVYSAVGSTWQRAARQRNALKSGTARMPAELLCAIFFSLSFQDRIASSHVCHSWRNVSLENPAQLWSVVPRVSQAHVLSALLRRTGTLPVILENVVLDEENGYAVGRTLHVHMHHIKSLRLELLEDLDGTPETLHDALQSPAPFLEKFVVFDKFGARLDLVDDHWTLFNLDAPRLRTVKLYGLDDAMPRCLSSASVTTLFLGTRTSGIGPGDIVDAFELFPRLVTLGVELWYEWDDRATRHNRQPHSITPTASLQRFIISTQNTDFVRKLLPCVVQDSIQIIDISVAGVGIYPSLMRPPWSSPMRPVAVEFGRCPGHSSSRGFEPDVFMTFTDEAGHRRTLRDLSIGGTHHIPNTPLFDSLASLCIELPLFTEQLMRRPFDKLPALQVLTITLVMYLGHFRFKDIAGWDARALECPSLATLELRAAHSHEHVLDGTSASDVVSFVRRWIQLGDRKLPCLRLVGEFGVDPSVEILQLADIAEKVVTEPGCSDADTMSTETLDWS